MRRNIFITVILILAVIGYWLFQVQSKEPKGKTPEVTQIAAPMATSAEENSKVSDQSIVSEDSQPKLEKSLTKEPDDDIKQALKALEDRRYSIDPLVEIQSVASEYIYCHETVMDYRLKDKQLTDKKTAQLEKLNQRCKSLEKSYGFLKDNNGFKSVSKKIKSMPSLTPLGDIYREEDSAAIRADFTSYFSRLTQQGIKAKNSQSMVQSAQIMNQPFMGVDPLLADILGGLDENYIRRTQHNALSLMSCDYQGGISCQVDAQIMIDKCLENELFCGMNFLDWYQLYTTDAQKVDVEALLAHYRQI